jgi:WD40 repeat protein
VAYAPSGVVLVSGSQDRILCLWNTYSKTSQLLRTIHIRTPLYCFAFSPDRKYLAYGGGDSSITIWNVQALAVDYAIDASLFGI